MPIEPDDHPIDESVDDFVKAALARASNAPPMFTDEEMRIFDAYTGPVLTGAPDGSVLPEDLIDPDD